MKRHEARNCELTPSEGKSVCDLFMGHIDCLIFELVDFPELDGTENQIHRLWNFHREDGGRVDKGGDD